MMKFFNNPENKVAVRQLVGWLWVALKGNRRQAIVNAMLGLLGVGVSLCSVWAMQRAIDIAAGAQQGSCLQFSRNKIEGGHVSIAKIFVERQFDKRFHVIRYLRVAHGPDDSPPASNCKGRNAL